MADSDLERRVRILEEKVDELRDVPARLTAVESQILQLRGEMGSGFSSLRAEMVRLNDETRTHMRVLHEEVIARIALLQEEHQPPPSRPQPTRRRKR
jgi:hypothetical protein